MATSARGWGCSRVDCRRTAGWCTARRRRKYGRGGGGGGAARLGGGGGARARRRWRARRSSRAGGCAQRRRRRWRREAAEAEAEADGATLIIHLDLNKTILAVDEVKGYGREEVVYLEEFKGDADFLSWAQKKYGADAADADAWIAELKLSKHEPELIATRRSTRS